MVSAEAGITSIVTKAPPQGQNGVAAGIAILLPTEPLACNLDFGIPVIRSAADKARETSNDRTASSEHPRYTACDNQIHELDESGVKCGMHPLPEMRVKQSSEEPFSDDLSARCKHHPGTNPSSDARHGDFALPEYIAKFIRADRQRKCEHCQRMQSGSQESSDHMSQTCHVTKPTDCRHSSRELAATIPDSQRTIRHTLSKYTGKGTSELPGNIGKFNCASQQEEDLSSHSPQDSTDSADDFDKPENHPAKASCHQYIVDKGVVAPKSMKTKTVNSSGTSQKSSTTPCVPASAVKHELQHPRIVAGKNDITKDATKQMVNPTRSSRTCNDFGMTGEKCKRHASRKQRKEIQDWQKRQVLLWENVTLYPSQ